MDALRILAKREGVVPKKQIPPLFDGIFLGSIEKHGRLHEMSLITKLNIASGRPFKDLSMLPLMLKRGKIRFRPERNNGGKEVRDLMRKVERLEARR
jgi:heterodisulfide reductase subunit C